MSREMFFSMLQDAMQERLKGDLTLMAEMKEKSSIPALHEAYTSFIEKLEFKPGDIVDFKPGLRGTHKPGPFIILEVLAEPVLSTEQNSNSGGFRLPLDIICGKITPEGNFVLWHFDSRLFQPVQPTISEAPAETENTPAPEGMQ